MLSASSRLSVELPEGLKLLRPFNPFKSRSDFPCPVHLTLNVYVGCEYGCRYCYGQSYIKDFCHPRPKGDFERDLERDIRLLKGQGLEPWVSISNSTDPLQPIEERYRHTLYSLKRLLEEGFPVLLLTKNPKTLLSPEYLNALFLGRARIHVTIPFLRKSPLEPRSPSPEERIEAVGNLVSLGFDVGVRIDPVIPWEGGLGQSPDELRFLVFRLADVGVKKIYTKGLRLMGRHRCLQPDFYFALKPLFRRQGIWKGTYFVLRDEEKARLLSPVIEAAREAKVEVFTCTDTLEFLGVRRCEFEAEKP